MRDTASLQQNRGFKSLNILQQCNFNTLKIAPNMPKIFKNSAIKKVAVFEDLIKFVFEIRNIVIKTNTSFHALYLTHQSNHHNIVASLEDI